GLALALGGYFLVRYSIEQGLLGPGVRIFLGAVFAAALVAGGEWARRTENLSGLSGLPSAHIPGVLTAAGTSVAYAVAYAAYALYGFLPPAAAFVLLGIVALLTLAAALLHGPALAALGLVDAVSSAALAAFTLCAAAQVFATNHDAAALATFVLLVVGTLAIAWRTDTAAAAVPAAGLLAILVIADWSVDLGV